MSTKIYTGFIAPAGVDIFDLQERLSKYLAPIILSEITSSAVEDIVYRYDLLTINNGVYKAYGIKGFSDKSEKDYPALTFNDLYWAYFGQERQDIKDPNDYKYRNAKISFMRHPETNEILILVNSSNNTLKALKKFDGIKEYNYWDNTDRPKRISAKEWEARSKKWDSILRSSRTLSLQSLVMTVIDPLRELISGDYFTKYKFILPTDNMRINRIVQSVLSEQFVIEGKFDKKDMMSSYMGYVSDENNRKRVKDLIEGQLKPFNVKEFRKLMKDKASIHQ